MEAHPQLLRGDTDEDADSDTETTQSDGTGADVHLVPSPIWLHRVDVQGNVKGSSYAPVLSSAAQAAVAAAMRRSLFTFAL